MAKKSELTYRTLLTKDSVLLLNQSANIFLNTLPVPYRVEKLADYLEDKFTTSNLSLSYRSVNYLFENHFLQDHRKNKKSWHKFSFRDCFYIELLHVLKQFKLSPERLFTIYSFFFETQPPLKLYQNEGDSVIFFQNLFPSWADMFFLLSLGYEIELFIFGIANNLEKETVVKLEKAFDKIDKNEDNLEYINRLLATGEKVIKQDNQYDRLHNDEPIEGILFTDPLYAVNYATYPTRGMVRITMSTIWNAVCTNCGLSTKEVQYNSKQIIKSFQQKSHTKLSKAEKEILHDIHQLKEGYGKQLVLRRHTKGILELKTTVEDINDPKIKQKIRDWIKEDFIDVNYKTREGRLVSVHKTENKLLEDK